MDSNTLFINILSIVLSSGVVGGIVKYLLSIELENFKDDLRVKAQKELEQLKTDLRIAAFQQETTFARLHEKRAEVIAELYAKLVAVHGAMARLVHPLELDEGTGRPQRDKDAVAAADEFSRYYTIHQIYLEESLCELIQKFNRDILTSWVMHKDSLEPGRGGMALPREREDAWLHLKQQVPPIRKEIEATFRKLLGLTPSSTTPSKAG